MTRSVYAVDVVLPQDLAELFGDRISVQIPVRSLLPTLAADGAAIASMAITFLQGPPAVGYWVEIVRGWLLRRRRDSNLGRLEMKGPGGEVSVVITADTDLTALATTMHAVLFPGRKTRPDPDDLAL